MDRLIQLLRPVGYCGGSPGRRFNNIGSDCCKLFYGLGLMVLTKTPSWLQQLRRKPIYLLLVSFYSDWIYYYFSIIISLGGLLTFLSLHPPKFLKADISTSGPKNLISAQIRQLTPGELLNVQTLAEHNHLCNLTIFINFLSIIQKMHVFLKLTNIAKSSPNAAKMLSVERCRKWNLKKHGKPPRKYRSIVVDLEKHSNLNSWLQISASIQPRTDHPNFDDQRDCLSYRRNGPRR